LYFLTREKKILVKKNSCKTREGDYLSIPPKDQKYGPLLGGVAGIT
jgi:hypothetical protein